MSKPLRLDRSKSYGAIIPPWSGDSDELPRATHWEKGGISSILTESRSSVSPLKRTHRRTHRNQNAVPAGSSALTIGGLS